MLCRYHMRTYDNAKNEKILYIRNWFWHMASTYLCELPHVLEHILIIDRAVHTAADPKQTLCFNCQKLLYFSRSHVTSYGSSTLHLVNRIAHHNHVFLHHYEDCFLGWCGYSVLCVNSWSLYLRYSHCYLVCWDFIWYSPWVFHICDDFTPWLAPANDSRFSVGALKFPEGKMLCGSLEQSWQGVYDRRLRLPGLFIAYMFLPKEKPASMTENPLSSCATVLPRRLPQAYWSFKKVRHKC